MEEKIYTAQELVDLINSKLEKSKTNFYFDGICFEDGFGYGYNVTYYKHYNIINDDVIRVYPIHTAYGKVYHSNIRNGFGKDYENFASSTGIGETNVDGINTLFKKEDFLKHILKAAEN